MQFDCHPRRLLPALFIVLAFHTTSVDNLTGQEQGLPEEAKRWDSISGEGVTAYVHEQTIWLKLDSSVVKSGQTVIPRLSAPIRSIRWLNQAKAELKFWPEPQEWIFSWKTAPTGKPVIEVVFDSKPVLPADCPQATATGDGSVMLHAYQATTFGEKLRFEPQWYKNTVGYWAVSSDYVIWNLTIDQPGSYSAAVLQGCGAGQGGSDAVITLRQGDEVKAELPFTTIDTGHFQNFRWHHLGTIDVAESGEHELRIDAKRIAKVALFDVRTIHLVRQAKQP